MIALHPAIRHSGLIASLLWTATVMGRSRYEIPDEANEVVWTLDLLGRNPGATLLCLTLSAGAAWGLRRIFVAAEKFRGELGWRRLPARNS